ncbi:Hpt domain-containing protein [Hahella ganghwensis]|uniref:Hpt domain-containing protein n=1 Tax=Hahella ganghwensis TaxID=286420 RepID=UPI0003754D8B|nr:Hpt domain-containing protein [Hahella ganghwensis]
MPERRESLVKLLAELRTRFAQELDERCNTMENLALSMEKEVYAAEQYNELYRRVHSLKGAGGTNGFYFITACCHQLESFLSELPAEGRLDSVAVNTILAYIDLLRRAKDCPQDDKGLAVVSQELENLSKKVMKKRWLVMVAEQSTMLSSLYCQVLESLPLKIVQEKNGLAALTRLIQDPFDLAIIGKELHELNGNAVMAALRSSHSNRRSIPAILVTSRDVTETEQMLFSTVLQKNERLAENIYSTVQSIVSA